MSISSCSSCSQASPFSHASPIREAQLQQDIKRANPDSSQAPSANSTPPAPTVNGGGQVIGRLINVAA